jgi:hypothetical protein
MPRTIKLGRKATFSPALHWAVKVGDTWYEISGPEDSSKGGPNRVTTNRGWTANSGAGVLGGEIVGETDKTDIEIYTFVQDWLCRNARYDFLADKSQKFSYEFIYFLTDGTNFRLPHRIDALTAPEGLAQQSNAFAINQDGVAIARVGSGETRVNYHHINAMYRGPSAEVSAAAGAGLGAWVGASPLGRAEMNVGQLAGVHFEPNINTGAGVRDGNLDVHVLGFGTRIGADGVEINTPLGGVNACTIS